MNRRSKWWLAAIVATAAIARFWGLRFGLPHTNTRPDETIIIDVALNFLRGNLRPVFYDYPWFYMWSLAGLYLLYFVAGWAFGWFASVTAMLATWRTHWVPFFLIPRSFSAVMGTATVLVVYRICVRLWDETTALVAALFMALAFLHVRDSHFGSTDITMTCLLVLSVSFLIDGHLSGRRRDFVIGGLIGGLSAATKYNALLLIVPLVTTYLINIYQSADKRRALLDPRLFVYGIPFLMTFAIGVPFLLFDLPKFIAEMQLLRQSMEIGSRGLELSSGWQHHLEYSLRDGMGLPLLSAALFGMALILGRESPIGLLLLSFPIAYFAVAGSLRNLFFRYAIPMVPFLCIAAARFVTRCTKRDGLIAAAALVLVAPTAYSTFQFDRIASQTDNRVVVARWFDEHVPEHSSVLMSGSSYGYVQFTRARDYKAWVWDRQRLIFVTDLDRRPAVGRPEWILVQDSPLPFETQPAVLEFLSSGYDIAHQFDAFSHKQVHVFDQQDAFFIPFAGFEGVDRPGPNYTLYRRSDVAAQP